MFKVIICTICPKGCRINVEINNREVLKLEGYKCKRGYEYVLAEIKEPSRVLTTTVRLKNGLLPVIPVKSTLPVPLKLMLECMKDINEKCVTAPIKAGTVIIRNISGTGADIVTTRSAN